MAIEWWDKIIQVPKAYLTLIQSDPVEIRELNINDFRLVLRTLEAAEEGVMWLYTHDHVAPVDVGGVTLARVVEIVNDYTVTFEDGQYAVNIVGGNSNIGDRVNVNQVSVRSANSAGLITSDGIEALEYDRGVCIDAINGVTGTIYPRGTHRMPVSNFADALLICQDRGFDKLFIHGNFTFGATDVIDDFTIIGEYRIATKITLTAGVSTSGTRFEYCNLVGTFSGTSIRYRCGIGEVYGVQGVLNTCSLTGPITVSGHADFIFCFSAQEGDLSVDIDMDDQPHVVDMRQFSGGIRLSNMCGFCVVSIDFASGKLELAASVMGGELTLRGDAFIEDDLSTGVIFNTDGLINIDAVWDETMADHLTDGTTGKKLYDGGTGDTAAIAAAVWDMVLYPDHVTDDTAGKYIYEFYKLVEAGDVYVSTSTSSEILMVRERLGDAGVLITETVIDEEAISTNTDAVFPAERLIYEVSGIWLTSDPTHSGTDYYDGVNGEVDTYTGKIIPHTSFPGDNTEVLINYTFMRGLPNTVIDQFLVEAKLYVKKYTRKDYDWSLGVGASPDEEVQIALMAACSIAAMRCLEVIATGDILQFGYNFRLGDLQVESMTSGGFHVQAHIDFLKGDVERKLAMLGRAMHFVARTTRSWGRNAHGYKRYAGGKRSVY